MKRRNAITLIEVIIVIAIIGLTLALLLSAIHIVRESAFRAQSMNNQRQIALGFHSYAASHSNQLPRSEHFPDGSWRSRLGALVNHVEGQSASIPIKWLLSPVDPTADTSKHGLTLCSYCMNWQVFKNSQATFVASIPDGLSSTFLLSEMYAVCDTWVSDWSTDQLGGTRRPYFGTEFTSPGSVSRSYRWPDYTYQLRPCAFPKRECGSTPFCFALVAQSPHRGGMLVAMADGSCRAISPSINHTVYWDLVSTAGGESVGSDW